MEIELPGTGAISHRAAVGYTRIVITSRESAGTCAFV